MQTTAVSPNQNSSLLPMVIIGGLFFIFGFITWLNGALVPFLQIVCNLNEIQAILIASTFYFAYVVMALPMAKVLEITGYRKAMSVGLGMISAGCLLYIPAAQAQSFALFLVAQFVLGTGLTLLQTASNPYIVKIGPEETAAVRISIMGILNKLAGVVAPMIFTVLVLGEFGDVTAKSIAAMSEVDRAAKITILADGLIYPYLWMAIALAVLALAMLKSRLPELNLNEIDQTTGEEIKAQTSLFAFPHLILGAATLFVYVGVEVIAGDTIGLFGSSLGVANATTLTSFTMAFMVLGYFLGLVLIPRVMTERHALLGSAVLGMILSVAVVFSSTTDTFFSEILWGWMGLGLVPNTITFIALLGFANAIVWPAIWPLALKGLGEMTAKASALLIMGIAGGAILPLVYGGLSALFSSQSAYWMMLPCYMFIFYYALIGCKIPPRTTKVNRQQTQAKVKA
ncbi:sugar MFS transporter [Glaciecola sp. SC05]|uniref:sugar MFS transporter n=1 Tax=Glaciecola sp. SC05 TaxID=1987355 RepID=UPI003526D9EF